jgi:hypothetical protein
MVRMLQQCPVDSSIITCCGQDALDKLVPEGHHYRHLDEGLDDMPAHVKVSWQFLALVPQKCLLMVRRLLKAKCAACSPP